MKPVWLLGGGGHAKSVIDAARSSGKFQIMGILDDAYDGQQAAVSGIPILGPISVTAAREHGISNAIIAIGDNRTRARICEDFDEDVHWETVVHQFSYVAADATLGHGTVICAGAVVQPAAVLGRHVIANTSSSIGHDCVIGDFCHVAPGSNLAGGTRAETGVFLGIGSRTLPLVTIGEWSRVGAGAVVTENLPAAITAVGIPARVR